MEVRVAIKSVSLYPLSFFASTPFNDIKLSRVPVEKSDNHSPKGGSLKSLLHATVPLTDKFS